MDLFGQIEKLVKSRGFWVGVALTGVAALVEVWILEKSYK